MHVLAFAASLRKNSLNQKLIRVAAQIAQDQGYEVTLANFADFTMPLYDGDLDAESGLPDGARRLCDEIVSADAILIATPEYNYSVAGPLKNAIDWVSRSRPMPWRGRSVYLMSASPSPMGGIRGLWQTRIPIEGCGALVFPDMFALPHANHAFNEHGQIVSIETLQRLKKELVGFLRLAEASMDICGEKAPPAFRDRQRQIADALEEQTELQSPSM